MCLIVFSFQQDQNFPLVVTANRDEFYRRPTRSAHWWSDLPIFAGRDLEAMGTWLGITGSGRFAAVTNVREPGRNVVALRSRGELTRDYLTSMDSPRTYLQELQQRATDYAGFNLLVGDHTELWFYSNRDREPHQLQPGLYGISNGAFDEPWPKLTSGKQAMAEQLRLGPDTEQLATILLDSQVYADHLLPQTGVPLEWERLLSSRFIRSDNYGTRASTVLTVSSSGVIDFLEQNFSEDGIAADQVSVNWQASETGGHSFA